MYELCMIFVTGVLLSIGWRLGALIFEGIRNFVLDAPNGIERIRRYKRRQQRRVNHYLTYDIQKRS